MTRDEARTIANQARAEYKIPDAATIAFVEERYIELTGVDEETAQLVRDALVWVVRFRAGSAWTDLAVEQKTGAIVRVERSRL